MKIFILITFFNLLILSACSIETDKNKTGPEGSWWLGGADGGVYIKIEDDNNPNDKLYQGVIFYDADKTVWYRGPFKLVGNIKFSIKDHDQYLFWDGEKVHLVEESYLQAIKPVPQL